MQIRTRVENLKNYKIYLQIEVLVNEYLQKKGYMKVDVPLMSPALIPESYIENFETEFKYFDKREKLYLTPSPELFIKRLLVKGIGDCYCVSKSFRNGEAPSSLHSPEFTMLEFYKMNARYMDMAAEILEFLKFIAFKLNASNKEKISEFKYKFRRWEWFTVAQAFHRFANINEDELFNQKLFLQKAKMKGYKTDGFSYEDVFSQIFVAEIEKNLRQGFATIVYDYPKELAVLAKLNPDGHTAQRFEFYINGIELGNCYTELTDWKKNEERFEIEIKRTKKKKNTSPAVDKGFIETLKYGLGNCSGVAIGMERLAMVLMGLSSINQLRLINIL